MLESYIILLIKIHKQAYSFLTYTCISSNLIIRDYFPIILKSCPTLLRTTPSSLGLWKLEPEFSLSFPRWLRFPACCLVYLVVWGHLEIKKINVYYLLTKEVGIIEILKLSNFLIRKFGETVSVELIYLIYSLFQNRWVENSKILIKTRPVAI